MRMEVTIRGVAILARGGTPFRPTELLSSWVIPDDFLFFSAYAVLEHVSFFNILPVIVKERKILQSGHTRHIITSRDFF